MLRRFDAKYGGWADAISAAEAYNQEAERLVRDVDNAIDSGNAPQSSSPEALSAAGAQMFSEISRAQAPADEKKRVFGHSGYFDRSFMLKPAAIREALGLG